jgi:acyl-CoA reductase-like NAD-dependent aldehyde dehydrogenase
MEAHANERLNQANEHNIERTGEAIARTIERASDDLVPRTPDERRRERLQQAQDHLADDQNEAAARRLEEQGSRLLGRRHSGHGRRRTSRSTCVTYTGPGPCNGMCVDFVNANPAQCR